MADQHHRHVPLDPGRVHAQDPLDLAYWCKELHCTEAQLKSAVGAVGEHVAEVRAHLAASPQGAGVQPATRKH